MFVVLLHLVIWRMSFGYSLTLFLRCSEEFLDLVKRHCLCVSSSSTKNVPMEPYEVMVVVNSTSFPMQWNVAS